MKNKKILFFSIYLLLLILPGCVVQNLTKPEKNTQKLVQKLVKETELKVPMEEAKKNINNYTQERTLNFGSGYEISLFYSAPKKVGKKNIIQKDLWLSDPYELDYLDLGADGWGDTLIKPGMHNGKVVPGREKIAKPYLSQSERNKEQFLMSYENLIRIYLEKLKGYAKL